MANYLEILPDELLMKIIKMATKDQESRRHEFLAGTIAEISVGFRRLAGDKSLWKGTVKTNKVEEVIDFLNKGVNNVFMDYGKSVTSYEIQVLADKCPKLKALWYPTISSWPTLSTPWHSLRYLGITLESNRIFDKVELHSSLPNLMYLHIRVNEYQGAHPFTLPDMRGCSRLKILILDGNELSVPDGILPFPTGLRSLQSRGNDPATINLNSDNTMGCLKNCKIQNVNFTS